jgi:hypothetical protein
LRSDEEIEGADVIWSRSMNKEHQVRWSHAFPYGALPTFFAVLTAGIAGIVCSSSASAQPSRWEAAIEQFEKQDQQSPPPQGEVLFLGSSSIRLWDLRESFPGQAYLNRGFGGSQLGDATYYVNRIVTPYKPLVVVVYAGDNDLAKDKTPQQVLADYQAFVTKVHAKLPATRIVYISIKPSLARWKLADLIRATNQRIAEFSASDPRLAFVDVFTPMLGDDQMPRAELLAADGLHLSPAGYELWASLVAPLLQPVDDEAADLILHHGKIVTVDQRFSIAEAISVKDGRIFRVGSNEQLLTDQRETTRLVDLAGKMVLPGLIDSHTHPGAASMHEFDHPVPDMESIDDVLNYIRSRAAAVNEGDWIWVNQVFITRLKEQRYPTKAELDRVAPQNPVVFSTGPDASVNSLALQVSGIDKDFQITGAGQIERDSQTGEPTGVLRGGTKRYLKSEPSGRQATEKDRDERLLALLNDYHSAGITAIADRNASDAAIRQYQRLHHAGKLDVRVAVSQHIDADGRLESVLDRIRGVADNPLCQGDAMLRIVGIKTFLDGGMLTGSAYMREPWGVSDIYSISDPRYRGVLFIEPQRLIPIVRTTVESGLQFTAHSVGDGAVHTLLDVYEEVNRSTPIRATRPCITHCNFMSGEAIDQMARLGIVADIQPAWLYLDARTLTAQFGQQRLRYFQPLRSIFEAGVIAGGGSDHMQKIGSLRSINPYNPLLGMWIAITRRAKWYDGQLHPEESLSREQAIRFYTINNAYLLFLDEQVGSLEPGKLADLIVLDRDVLQCPVDQIKDAQVLETYLNGTLVFQRSINGIDRSKN